MKRSVLSSHKHALLGMSFKTFVAEFQLGDDEELIAGYYSSLRSKDVGTLTTGTLYLTSNVICFLGHEHVYGKEVKTKIDLSDVQAIMRKSTAKFIPNAVTVVLKDGRKYRFGSLINRHETYKQLTDAWERKVRTAQSESLSRMETAKQVFEDRLQSAYEHIARRYEVRDMLAKGGYGSTFLVIDRRNFRTYVLKQVACPDATAAKQAEKEMVLLRLMKHPFIVSYKDFWRQAENVLTVMEYCSGGDLSHYLESRDGRYVEEDQIWLWLLEVTMALSHLHKNLVIHRDIKSQNLFLNEVGDLKLGDFGLSTVRKSRGKKSDVAVGTYGYAAPELMKQKSYDSQSDIYSLGCTFYEVLTLRSAYSDYEKGFFPMPMPTVYSMELRNLVNSMLTEDPARRPTAEAILACPRFADYQPIVEKLAMLYGQLSQRDELANELWHRIEVLESSPTSVSGASRGPYVVSSGVSDPAILSSQVASANQPMISYLSDEDDEDSWEREMPAPPDRPPSHPPTLFAEDEPKLPPRNSKANSKPDPPTPACSASNSNSKSNAHRSKSPRK